MDAASRATVPADLDSFGATAIAGAAGSSAVSLAGAVAVNIATLDTHALVSGADPVDRHRDGRADGDLAQREHLDREADARGDRSAVNTVGVGASVATNIVNASTAAGITDGTALPGRDGSDHRSPTRLTRRPRPRTGGASGGTGAVAAVYGLTTSNVTTTADHRHGACAVGRAR